MLKVLLFWREIIMGKLILEKKRKKAGCLEEKGIRTGICEIMEGGSAAFKKREEKYRKY